MKRERDSLRELGRLNGWSTYMYMYIIVVVQIYEGVGECMGTIVMIIK